MYLTASVARVVARTSGAATASVVRVSSSTSAANGACMAAPVIAAAATTASLATGAPGHTNVHASPSSRPRTAPVAITGVNRPPFGT